MWLILGMNVLNACSRSLRLIVAALAFPAVFSCGPGLAGGLGNGGEGEGEGEGEVREPIDVGDPPFGYDFEPKGPSTGDCSTGQWWVREDRESELMHPGDNCTACHLREDEGPILPFAGTVFQRRNDEIDCRGIPDALIEILDADGNVAFSMTANAAGNFFDEDRQVAAVAPYRARVTYDGRSVEMLTAQTDGACNRCHTAAGLEGAPGRIIVP